MCSVHFLLQVEKAAWKFYKKVAADKITYMWRASEDLRTLQEDGNFWQVILQKYTTVWQAVLSVRCRKSLKNMCMLKPYKIPCNLSDADNVFHLTVCTYRGTVTVCAICRLPAISYRWSYMSVEAALEKIKSVNCWQTFASTSMYIEVLWRSVRCW